MAQPSSPAQALHDVLAEVNSRTGEQASPSAYHAWQATSGYDHGSSAFAQYHAELMELLSEVAEDITTLRPEQQARYRIYLPKWWDALVRPTANWAQNDMKIIDADALHMLGALADVNEERAFGSGPRNPDTVDLLHKAVTFLLAQVEEAQDIPSPVRRQIEADLAHVLWLLKNVSTFGVDHAVAAVEKVTGKVVVAASKSPGESLRRIAIGLSAALFMISTLTGSAAEIASNVRTVFGIQQAEDADTREGDIIQQSVTQIYNTCNAPALPPGSDASPDDDTVEGEIVDE